MSKSPKSKSAKAPESEFETLLAKGCPTFRHIDETGRPPEAVYEGSGHDRMDADVVSKANYQQHNK